MVITVLVMLFVTTLLGAFVSLSVASSGRAKTQISRSTLNTSAITMTDLLAGAFKQDFESLSAAELKNELLSSGVTAETYDAAVRKMSDLFLNGTAERATIVKTTDPGVVLSNIVYAHAETEALMSSLMRASSMKIAVLSPIEIDSGNLNNKLALEHGDMLYLKDITFEVTFVRGLNSCTRRYVLSGEQVVAAYETARVRLTVDGTNAKITATAQTLG